MKKYISSTLALSVVLALSGCSGGSSDTTVTPVTATTTTTSGTASDGYLSGSTVCFDVDANGNCDAKEPVTVTDVNGTYSLTIAQSIIDDANASAGILITGGMDIDSKSYLVGSLTAPFTPNTVTNITPLSTMVHSLVKKGVAPDEAYTKVADALGLTADEVKADPVKLYNDNNNTKVIATSMALNRMVTMLVEIGDDNSSQSEQVYGALATTIENIANANDTNKSVGNLVAALADEPNSTLPDKVKEAAKVAPVIETQIADAVESNNDLSDAALVADAVVDTVQREVETAIDNNDTIDDTFVQEVDGNATTLASSVDPTLRAIENIFDSYHLFALDGNPLPESQALIIKNAGSFTASSDVNVPAIIDTNSSITDSNVTSLITELAYVYKVEQVKIYLLNLGIGEADWSNPELDEGIAHYLPNFSLDMTPEDFSAALYATNDPEMMALALQIAPPANVANLTDVQKAKDLFESLRTQVNSVSNSSLTGYADTESVKINDALQKVAVNTELATAYLDGLTNDIMTAMDANQTSVAHSINADGSRAVALTQTTTSGTITWVYDINQTNSDSSVTHWTGTVSFPDIDYNNFDPSSFTTLHATLNGDFPLDDTPVTTTGVIDKQILALDAIITKTSVGADFALNASIESNGDSFAITNVTASIAYTTDATTKEPTPIYVQLHNLTIKGVVDNYTLEGELDVNAYAQNSIMAAKGGAEIEIPYTWFTINAYCTNGSLALPNTNLEFTFNGTVYTPNWLNYYNNNSFNAGYEIEGNITLADVNNSASYNYTLTCVDSNGTDITASALQVNYYFNTWTETQPNNSGYLPSDVSFVGKLSNSSDNSYFEGTITAKWLDVASANFDDENYAPQLDVSMSGKLQMPESPLMNVVIGYDSSNVTIPKITATYIYDQTSVALDSTLDKYLENGTVNISSSTGIESTLNLVNGEVDYATSTLTTSDGKTLGSFVDISGVPSIRYIDGSFESLP